MYFRLSMIIVWGVLLYLAIGDYRSFMADPEEYTRYHGELVDYTMYRRGRIYTIIWTALGVLAPLFPGRYGRKAVRIHGWITLGLSVVLIFAGIWNFLSGNME